MDSRSVKTSPPNKYVHTYLVQEQDYRYIPSHVHSHLKEKGIWSLSQQVIAYDGMHDTHKIAKILAGRCYFTFILIFILKI